MSCIYKDNDGMCGIVKETGWEINGSVKGRCMLEEYSEYHGEHFECDEYVSDWICNVCGADLNLIECNCRDGVEDE
jgi:hypothetical protein